jgi:hypothetical protein
VHIEQLPVFCPFLFVFNPGKSVEGIAEIGTERPLEIPDILVDIFRILIEMKMEEAVELLSVENFIRVEGQAKYEKEEDTEE